MKNYKGLELYAGIISETVKKYDGSKELTNSLIELLPKIINDTIIEISHNITDMKEPIEKNIKDFQEEYLGD